MIEPKWIVVDGCDGVSKGTVIKNILKTWEVEKYGPIKSVYDPGVEEGHPMNTIRTLVKQHDMLPETELLLFQACRLELVNKVNQYITSGNNVVCDRFVTSTIIYQGVLKEQMSLIDSLSEIFKLRTPDITIIMNAPFDVITERLENRFKTTNPNMDKFKSSELFRRRVYDEYNQLLKLNTSLVELNVEGTPNEVLAKFYQLLEKHNIIY